MTTIIKTKTNRSKLMATLAIAAVLALGALAAPGSANARHWDHRDGDWGRHREWRGHRVWTNGYYSAPPVVYGNPYYDPGYYPPPVVYGGPGLGINLNIR